MRKDLELSLANTALLGLLCEGPMHPWQIEKTVKERSMRTWTDLSQSTIYKELHALQRAGCVTCKEEKDHGRLRRVYSPTPRGRKALVHKLLQLLSEPEQLKYRIDLATYNIDLLPRRDALACLRTYREKLVEGIECYRRLEEYLASCDCPAHRRALARRPRYLLQGEITWVDEFISLFEEQP